MELILFHKFATNTFLSDKCFGQEENKMAVIVNTGMHYLQWTVFVVQWVYIEMKRQIISSGLYNSICWFSYCISWPYVTKLINDGCEWDNYGDICHQMLYFLHIWLPFSVSTYAKIQDNDQEMEVIYKFYKVRWHCKIKTAWNWCKYDKIYVL